MSASTTTITTAPYTRPADVRIDNREAWLMAAAERLIGRVIDQGGERPKTLRVACGWPSKNAIRTASSRSRRIGEAWHSDASEDGAREVFISPALADEVEVMDVLLHELIHACLPAGVGHRHPFPAIARAVGLEGKPTATYAGDQLVAELRVIAHELGRYPHARLDVEPGAKKPGRMVKGYCPDCGNILYGSRAAWDAALPACGVCNVSYVVDPSPEQAAAWGLKPAEEAEPLENVSTTIELRTKDGRFTLRSTKTGGREGQWTVTDHEAVPVTRRAGHVVTVDEDGTPEAHEAEVVGYEPRWTIRRNREDALAFIRAIREGEVEWDDVELEAHEDDAPEADDDDFWGELGDWSASESDLYLDDDEEEDPDYEDGTLPEDEEAEYERLTALREESGRRKSESIARGDEDALD